MNFLFGNTVKLRTDVIFADRGTGELFTDRMRQVFIALPVFKKEEEECENDFERWIYTLKNMETLKRMPFKARKAVFEKLEEIADVSSLSQEERRRYENSVNVYRTNLYVLDAAKEEGAKEKSLSIARSLKQLNTPIDVIVKSTGLSEEEITAL